MILAFVAAHALVWRCCGSRVARAARVWLVTERFEAMCAHAADDEIQYLSNSYEDTVLRPMLEQTKASADATIPQLKAKAAIPDPVQFVKLLSCFGFVLYSV